MMLSELQVSVEVWNSRRFEVDNSGLLLACPRYLVANEYARGAKSHTFIMKL